MDFWRVFQSLKRLHDLHGRAKDLQGYAEAFNRARSLNPQEEGSWDLFGMRNEQCRQIVGILQRAQRKFRQARSASLPNSLFSNELLHEYLASWMRAHAQHGKDSRQARTRRIEFADCLYRWAEWNQLYTHRTSNALRNYAKYRNFYINQRDLAHFLREKASIGVSFGYAPAFVYYQDFDRIGNLSNSISRDLNSAIDNATGWKNKLDRDAREIQIWSVWSRNDRALDRDLDRKMSPLGKVKV